MADNFTITPGSGETISAKETGGSKRQRVMVTGGDAALDCDYDNPLPVAVAVPHILYAAVAAFRHTDLDETPRVLHASPGTNGITIKWMYIFNKSAGLRYLKLYRGASPTVGTTAPDQTYELQVGRNEFNFGTDGLICAVNCWAAVTVLSPDNDTTAPDVGDVLANIYSIAF